LDENQIPQFKEAFTSPFTTQTCPGEACLSQYCDRGLCDFTAWAAWTDICHLPKVIFTPKEKHVVWIEIRLLRQASAASSSAGTLPLSSLKQVDQSLSLGSFQTSS